MEYGFGTWVIISAASPATSQQVLTLPDEQGMPIQQKSRALQVSKAGNDSALQEWQFVSEDPHGVFKIVSVVTGNVLSVHSPTQGEHAVIVQAPDHGAPNQRWVLQLVDIDESGGDFVFLIRSAGSGRVLSVHDASTEDHAIIEQQKWQDGRATQQQWKIEPPVFGGPEG